MRFSKMHGAGNDFVMLDLRHGMAAPSPELCARLADRHTGVGCDQLLTIEDAAGADVVANYRIWNADGSASGQCGNGARCVAAWLVRDGAAPAHGRFIIASPAGQHTVEHDGDGGFAIDMGPARFAPAQIPLHGFEASNLYTLHVGAEIVQFGAVSMGNPHAVIEVDDVGSADVQRIGPLLQASTAFPQSANIGFAQVLSPTQIRLRVFERGVGETLACGSGACAAVAVLAQRGRVQHDAQITVQLPGGDLRICANTHTNTVLMAGPAAFVFEGEWL